MTERQRKLLLIIVDRFLATGKRPCITDLKLTMNMSDSAIYDDVNEMRELGMLNMDKARRVTETTGFGVVELSLTPKAEKILSRVRELA